MCFPAIYRTQFLIFVTYITFSQSGSHMLYLPFGCYVLCWPYQSAVIWNHALTTASCKEQIRTMLYSCLMNSVKKTVKTWFEPRAEFRRAAFWYMQIFVLTVAETFAEALRISQVSKKIQRGACAFTMDLYLLCHSFASSNSWQVSVLFSMLNG